MRADQKKTGLTSQPDEHCGFFKAELSLKILLFSISDEENAAGISLWSNTLTLFEFKFLASQSCFFFPAPTMKLSNDHIYKSNHQVQI